MSDQHDVLSFAQWQKLQEEDLDQTAETAQYNHMTDDLPDHAFYRLDTEEIQRLSGDISERVKNAVAYAGPKDHHILELSQTASNVAEVPSLKSIEIAAVGQQGCGKSTMINALQHCEKVSKTSASGQACTASPIRFCHKARAKDLEVFEAQVNFMNDTELKEVIDEHCRNYYHFHSSKAEDLENFAECCLLAEQAESFIRMFDDEDGWDTPEQTLDDFLNCENIINESIPDLTLSKAQKYIDNITGPSRLSCFSDYNDAQELRENVDHWISCGEDETSLWPIVQGIDIKFSSLLTKYGVSICDLPGEIKL